MSKILVGAGCSHTQGDAFINILKPKNENGEWELRTDDLKTFYGRDFISEKFITNELSWMAKLNKYLKYDKILNFGLGGRGVEAVIRSLRSYTYNIGDLSNHLIVIQLPVLTRVEILNRIGNDLTRSFSNYEVCVLFPQQPNSMKGLDRIKNYFMNHFNSEYYEYKFLNDIYFLQDYLEMKGAKVFTTTYNPIENFDDLFNRFEILKGKDDWLSYFTPENVFNAELHTPPKITEIVKKINWLFCNKSIKKDLENSTLKNVGLHDWDSHYAESGNEIWAKNIYMGLNKNGIY